jgi:hypothetical protein
MSTLPVKRACELTEVADQPTWLIDGLWAEQAVGILGGEPKCCKSFLALDIAVGVASGSPCLRRFHVRRTGPVLFFPAEDSLGVVHRRLEGICHAAGAVMDDLPLFVITVPRLLLDLPQDRERLRETVAAIRPVLLVLDPFIRLHRGDENASKEIAPLLGYLRELQRQFHTAVLLVHHVRKGSAKDRPGQALRGSSDMHGWGDSNLYLRRNHRHLLLCVEHRAAPSRNDIPVDLASEGESLALEVLDLVPDPEPGPLSTAERVVQALSQADQPLSSQQLRRLCRVRTATLCETLAKLRRLGRVVHGSNGYSLPHSKDTLPVSFPTTPIDPSGNGNGKRPAQTQLPLASSIV